MTDCQYQFCDRWDLEQADRYARSFAILDLAIHPGLGRAGDDIREGYFRMGSGSHVIFYRRLDDDIGAVRILHARMDLRRHLD